MHSAPFVATGNATVKLACTTAACTAVSSPLLIKGSLLSPVSITPSSAIGPTGHAAPGCASKTPTWTLSDVYLDSDTTLGGDGKFNFLLTNAATGYEASCFSELFAEGSRPGASSTTTMNCAGNEFQSLGFDQYRMSTTIVYDSKTNNITVTQTWFCDDVDASKP